MTSESLSPTPSPLQGNGSQEMIIAVDPGRAKCGVAVVSGPAPVTCVHRGVVESLRLTLEVADLMRRHPGVTRLVVGSGTGSATLRRALRSSVPDIPVEIIDEHRSSERARQRYVEQNVPAGWRRLVPPSLRTPDRPYDDYVAQILAEDYFARKTAK
jgi:RNase H-fold protein (predicted Holliday junction resolvase)